MVVTRGWGEGNSVLLFNGYQVYGWDDENVPEMDSGDGRTTLWMC